MGLQAQEATPDSSLLGEYRTSSGQAFVFDIYKQNGKLLLQEVVGQGTVELNLISGARIRAGAAILPKAKIEFLKDSSGRISQLRWVQSGQTYKWIRTKGEPGSYEGAFQLKDNPYRVLHLTGRGGKLIGHIGIEPEKEWKAIGHDRFVLAETVGKNSLVFKRDSKGLIHELTTTGDDRLDPRQDRRDYAACLQPGDWFYAGGQFAGYADAPAQLL